MIVNILDPEEGSIQLKGENEAETLALRKLERYGVKVFCTGTCLCLTSPKASGQIAVYLDRDEQAAIAYALGVVNYSLANLDVNQNELLKKILQSQPLFI